MRGGKALPLKSIADEALAAGGCEAVKSVIVYRRTGGNVAWTEGRDLWMHELVEDESDQCEPEWVSAELSHEKGRRRPAKLCRGHAAKPWPRVR